MKRLTVFLDGTWQKLDQPDPTNIAKLAQSVAHTDSKGTEQIVYYDRGVGADSLTHKATKRMISGITGEGLEDSLMNAYMFLCWNYTTGDEIYIFGFSRGAFTARSLCGLIRNAGLLHRPYAEMASAAYKHYRSKHHPDVDESAEFRKNYSYDPVPITYVGVFDTVGQRGVPRISGRLEFRADCVAVEPQTAIPRSGAQQPHSIGAPCLRDRTNCVARFPVTPWENLDELNHARGATLPIPRRPTSNAGFPAATAKSAAGVGSKLANITLDWVAKGAAMCGLEYTADKCPLLIYTAPELQDPFVDLLSSATGWRRSADANCACSSATSVRQSRSSPMFP